MPDEGSSNENDTTKQGIGGKGAMGDLVKAESMVQLAIALPAGCLIGWLIGSWADRHFHQGWIGILGIILGAVGGLVQIFTTASRYLKRG
jgi:ATP synthase protein I